MENMILYYSHTGTIESLIPRITNIIKSDTYRIELDVPYPIDTKEFVTRVREELKNNLLPAYKSKPLELKPYKNIYIIVPNWGNTIPPVVKTFLYDVSLKGKTIYPIISHGGNGEAGMVEQIKTITKSTNLEKELVIYTNEITDSELKTYFLKG